MEPVNIFDCQVFPTNPLEIILISTMRPASKSLQPGSLNFFVRPQITTTSEKRLTLMPQVGSQSSISSQEARPVSVRIKRQRQTKQKERQLQLRVKFRKAVHLLMGIQREQRMSKDMVVKAKAALFKSIPNRSEEDYMWIERFMMRLEFIHHLREEHGLPLVREFCRNLYYQRFNEGDEVIHVNREGRTFYVILSGSVAVYVYRPKNETVNSRMKKLIKNHEEECIDYDDSIQFERAEVKVLVQGESFGELSLLDFRNRTTATIVAKQVCEFSCLDRKQYWEILGRIKRTEIEEKLGFISRLQIFQKWTQQDIKTLSYHFEILACQREQKILVEGKSNKFLFFVKQGQFEILKHQAQQNDELSFLQRLRTKRLLSISLLVYGEMFGQDEFLGRESNYFTIKCTHQNSQLYRISYHDLAKRLWDKEARNHFTENLNIQFQWRVMRFEQLLAKQLEMSNVNDSSKSTIEILSRSVERMDHSKEQASSPYQLRPRSKHARDIPSPPKDTIKYRMTLKETLDKEAHKALKKGKIERFMRRSEETETFEFDTQRINVIPRITTQVKPLYLDSLDPLKGFETLERYRIPSRGQPALPSPRTSPLRDSSPHCNPIRLNQFLQFAAHFSNTDVTRVANSFYHLVWMRKTQQIFNVNLKIFEKETRTVPKKHIYELIKFYLENTLEGIPAADPSRYHYINSQLDLVQQVFVHIFERESRYVTEMIAKIKAATAPHHDYFPQ